MTLKFWLSPAIISIPFLLFAQHQPADSYTFNRAPLQSSSYIQLPLGSIKAKGWLLKQLELQKEGATGHAEELYPEAENLGSDSDWLGGKGNSWERVPYYVKGLIALAYTLDDPELKARSQKWIDWTLNHQQSNGAFGPVHMNDWWPRMPMMYAIQSYYEATADKRVIEFFNRYFKYQLENLDRNPLKEWSKSRVGDNMELALWLYNRTGEKYLLNLTEKLKAQAYPWAEIYSNNEFYHFGDDFHTKHSVSVGQALKFPAIYAQLNPAAWYLQATEKGITHLMRDHGQSSGIASGTEFLAGRSSFQGTETCTVVEWMQSLETVARIVHHARIGDRLEQIAFNTLPAQFSRDLKAHFYYTQPNQLFSKKGQPGFDEDYDNGLLLSPYSGMGCCRYNMHMGWPYFVKNSWVATPDKGLAVVAYAPVELNAFVAEGIPVKMNIITNYPFEEQIRIKIDLPKSTAFPIKLRIPEWCNQPQVLVNGKAQPDVKSGQIYTIDRSWKTADEITLHFPMKLIFSDQVNQSVSVQRGPLVFGLKINAEYSILKKHPIEGFSDYQITPASDWNYGLVLNRRKPDGSIKVQIRPMPENPFIQETTPILLKINAKKIPSWTLAGNLLHAFEVPPSPVVSTEKTEEITLSPFGTENIRISNFPVIGEPEKSSKLLKEDFRNASLKDWLIYGGSWYIKDKAIHSASNNGSWGYGIHGSKALKSGTLFQDLSYEAHIQLNSKGQAGLIFRVRDAALGANAYEGYYVGLDVDKGQLELGKSSGGRWVLLGAVKQTLARGQSYKIRVEARADQITVYLNGSADPVITAQDDEFKSGMIGVRAYDAMCSISHLLVKSIMTNK